MCWTGKMKTPEEIEEICKKLKPIIGEQAQNLWYMYLAEDEKNRKDLVLNIELIAEKLLKEEALELSHHRLGLAQDEKVHIGRQRLRIDEGCHPAANHQGRPGGNIPGPAPLPGPRRNARALHHPDDIQEILLKADGK